MSELFDQWLSNYLGNTPYLASIHQAVGLSIILLACLICYYLARHQFLVFINKVVLASKNQWDDLLLQHRVFKRIALLFPYVALLLLSQLFLIENSLLLKSITVIAKIAITMQVAVSISAILNVTNGVYFQQANAHYFPINATIQVIKLLVYLVAIILAISYALDKSPIYLLSGLGAITAVLLLVFQDTIKGLVASIQISAYKMVAIGDWIEMPKYGADGDVLEIGLNTVKVQNWDKTITTIPTYALTTDAFKNWRGMVASGGRRIKRSLMVDISSIHFCSNNELHEWQQIKLLQPYFQKKLPEVDLTNKALANEALSPVNLRKLTNIGTFRAYITAYLQQHPLVHKQMTCMVRQLPATATGLPLELYCFSQDLVWVNYENLQADIFDHIYAMAPVFNLRIFQHPTGADWRQSKELN